MPLPRRWRSRGGSSFSASSGPVLKPNAPRLTWRRHSRPSRWRLDTSRLSAAPPPVAGRVACVAVLAGDRLAAGQVGARVLPLANEAALHGFALLEGGGESSAVAGLRDRLGRQDIALTTPFAAMVAARPRNQGEQ